MTYSSSDPIRIIRKGLVCYLLLVFSLIDAGWHDRKAEGWAWYEDMEKEEVKKETPKKQTSAEILAEAKKELEEKLADAIIDPAQENIVAYLKLQREWLKRSSKFSKEVQRALLDLPYLDPTVSEFPVSHYGRQVAKRINNQRKRERISDLSKDYGMLFFYNGDVKVSQACSFVVRDFAKKYNWDIVGISCDGILLEGFSKNKLDLGIAEKFGVEVQPSLFALTPKTQEAVAITHGLSTLDKIENNLMFRFLDTKEDTHD